MTKKRLLDVGQCDADHSRISQMLNANFDVEIHRSHSSEETLRKIAETEFDLVLINRLLDINGDSGLEILKQIKSGSNPSIPVMLISNYEVAQQTAIENGAIPGFGKAALHAPKTLERLGEILGC